MNIATFTNPKMINSAIRSTILTVITGAVIWLLNSHWITQNQVAGTSAVILGGVIWGATALWGILSKRDPKLAAELEAVAHRLGIDPADLIGITPTQVADQVVAAAAKTLVPATAYTTGGATITIDGTTTPLTTTGINAGALTTTGTNAGTVTNAAGALKQLAPALLVLALVLPGLVGCQTLNTQAANITPAQVTTACNIVQHGTTDGVNLLLAKYPKYKGDVVLVDQALNAYITAGNTDPVALQTALDKVIPAADQADVQPAVDTFCLLYEAYASQWVNSAIASNISLADLQQLLKAIDAGLNAALNSPAPVLISSPAIAAPAAGSSVTVSFFTPAS